MFTKMKWLYKDLAGSFSEEWSYVRKRGKEPGGLKSYYKELLGAAISREKHREFVMNVRRSYYEEEGGED